MYKIQRGRMSPHASKPRDQRADAEEPGLIQRLKAGDHEAFEALFQRYVSMVYQQAMRILGQQAEAEEVVQGVFLTVYEKADSFRGQSAFSTWLHRITVNATLSKLRRRKRSEEFCLDEYLSRFQDDGDHIVKPIADCSNALEERPANEEIQQLIRKAIEQLSPMDQAVVVLSDLDGLSDREVGAARGLTVGAVKSRLHRSRLFLRGKLAVKLGYSPACATPRQSTVHQL